MRRMSHPRLYPEILWFRVSEDVRAAVDQGAIRARCGRAEYARQIIMAGLEAKGVTLPDPLAPATGA